MAERAMCETHQKLRNLNHLTASVGPQGDTHYTCNPQDRCKGSRFHSYDGAEQQQQQRPFNPYPQNPNQPAFQPSAYLWDANALAAMAMQHQADGSNGPRRGMVGMGGRGGGVVGGYGLAPAQFGNLAGGVPPHQEKLRCQEHNKMRSANAMDWNERLKGYVCKPAMRCKSGKGHTEAMVTSETALCALHNKRRRREFLDSRPDGSFQCREGQTCQAKTIEQQGNVAQQLIAHQAHQ